MPTPAITEAEWEVMAALWAAAGPLTGADVVAALAGGRPRSPRTVKALLNRLLNKGAVAATAEGNRYLYRPAVDRDRCVRAAGRSFAARVFGSSAGALLVHFVTDAELSAAEVAQLQQLLGEKRAAAAKPGRAKKGR